MAKKKARVLRLGPGGEVRLPQDALESLDIEPGGEVEIFVDTRRKQIRLERHVQDAWAEAFREKPKKGFDDLRDEQSRRDDAAAELFEKKLKEPPSERSPEDNPDLWR